MALAWDRQSLSGPESTREWLEDWSGRQFGDAVAEKSADIMTIYGKLTARMKYEDLSRTPFAFNTVNYDEAELNYKEWTDLLEKAQAVHDSLPAAAQVSFFEVVLHPVLAGKTVFEIYTKVALGSKYANEHRTSANQFARDVQAAFSADQAITKRYHSLLNNKWDRILSQTHIGYNNWQEPASNSLPRLSYTTGSANGALMGIYAQGGSASFPGTARLTLPAVSPYLPPGEQARWLDVYTRDNGTFTYRITTNASFVSVSNPNQTLASPNGKSDARASIIVDWASAPSGTSTAALTVTNLNSTSAIATVLLPIQNVAVPADFKGHVESSGVVSIEAEHFSSSSSSRDQHIIVPDYGRTLSGVKLPPQTASQTAGKGPVLVYPFYTFSTASSASVTVYLAPSENARPSSPNKFSFSVDGGQTTTVQVVGTTNGSSQPAGWSEAVVQGAYVKKSTVGRLSAGKHELRFWLLEPTMVVTKIVVDVGGLKSSLLGPPESFIVV